MKDTQDKQIQDTALLIASCCVRNTIIEDYHAEGKLNDKEMKAFNKEVVNKIYTFLKFTVAAPSKEKEIFERVMQFMYPANWDKPELDKDMLAGVDNAMGKGKK